jgi:ABC-type polysaccharide/polyol phosphate transport system ATPase subunit
VPCAHVGAWWSPRLTAGVSRSGVTSGRTVLFVSYHRAQVVEVCQRVIWLEEGTIRGIGPAAEVLEAYERAHGVHGFEG